MVEDRSMRFERRNKERRFPNRRFLLSAV